MKRYRLYTYLLDFIGYGLEEAADGDVVLYEEAQQAIAAAFERGKEEGIKEEQAIQENTYWAATFSRRNRA